MANGNDPRFGRFVPRTRSVPSTPNRGPDPGTVVLDPDDEQLDPRFGRFAPPPGTPSVEDAPGAPTPPARVPSTALPGQAAPAERESAPASEPRARLPRVGGSMLATLGRPTHRGVEDARPPAAPVTPTRGPDPGLVDPGLQARAAREAILGIPRAPADGRPRSAFGEVLTGARVGLESSAVGAGESLEQLGELTGSEGIRARGELLSQDAAARQEAASAGSITRIGDVHSLQDFTHYAAFAVGQGLGSSAAPLVGGAVGAAAGSVIPGVGTGVGATVGAFGPSYGMLLGEIRQALEAEAVDPRLVEIIAPIVAVPAAGLDVLLPRRVVTGLATGAPLRFGIDLAKRIVRRALEGGFVEGITEGLQGLLTKGAVAGSSPHVEFLTIQTLQDLVNDALAGALPGSVLGGAGGALEGISAEPEVEPQPTRFLRQLDAPVEITRVSQLDVEPPPPTAAPSPTAAPPVSSEAGIVPPEAPIVPEEGPPVPPGREIVPPAAPEPSPQSRPLPLPPIPAAEAEAIPIGEPIPALSGKSIEIRVPDGRALRARYGIVAASSAPTSHDPFTLQPNPEFMGGNRTIQERRYETDVEAQTQLAESTRDFEPGEILDPTSMATSGPPILRADGERLSGNFRGILIRRVAQENPAAYQRYLNGIISSAQTWGMSEAQARGEIEALVRAGEVPELVRIVDDPSADLESASSLAEWMSAFNDVATRSRDPVAESATRARRMREAEGALGHFQETISPDDTVRSYLSTAAGRRFLERLVEDGVVTREEASEFIDRKTGLATQDARLAIERLLLVAAVGDPEIVDRAPPGTLRKIDRAVPAIVQTQRFAGWDMSGVLQEALNIHTEARASGISVLDLLSQLGFDTPLRSVEAERLALFVDESGPTQVANAIRAYADEAAAANRALETQDMFGHEPRQPQEAFLAHFQPSQEFGRGADGSAVRESVGRYQRWRRWVAGMISPELRSEAERDPITGLPNIRAEGRAVASAVERRGGPEAPTSIVRYRIDIDNFKALNDSLGHQAGDEALRVVGRVLEDGIRDGDVLSPGRIGGDEFVLTATIAQDVSPEAIRDRLEGAINRALREAGYGEANGAEVGASIGFAVHNPGETFLELDSRADRAAIERKARLARSRPRDLRVEESHSPLKAGQAPTPAERTQSAEIVHGSELQATRTAQYVNQLSLEMATTTHVAVDLSVEGRMRRVADAGLRAWVTPVGKRIRGPASVHRIMAPFLRSPASETFAIILTDEDGQVLFSEGYSSGAMDYVVMGSELGLYMRSIANRWGAAGVWLTHNHPSGDPRPSPEDRAMTVAVRAALEGSKAKFLGHVVIDHSNGTLITAHQVSLEEDLWTTEATPFRVAPATERDWTHHHGLRVSPDMRLADVEAFAGSISRDSAYILWVSTQLQVVALSPHRISALDRVGEWFPQVKERLGAWSAVLLYPSTPDAPAGSIELLQEALTLVRKAGLGNYGGFFDVFAFNDFGLLSARDRGVYEPKPAPSATDESLAPRTFRYEADFAPRAPSWIRASTQTDLFSGWSSSDPGHQLEPLNPAPLTPVRPFQVPRVEYVGAPEVIAFDAENRPAFIPSHQKRLLEWHDDTLAAISEGLITPESAVEKGAEEFDVGDFELMDMDGKRVPYWHVTTALGGVLQRGLRTGFQVGPGMVSGLDAGPTNSISLTEDSEMATTILDALLLGRQVARGEVSIFEMVGRAERGVDADEPYDGRLFDSFRGPEEDKDSIDGGPTPEIVLFLMAGRGNDYWLEIARGRERDDSADRTFRGLNPHELLLMRWFFFKRFLSARYSAGGPWDAEIFHNSPEILAYRNEEDIAILTVLPVEGARGVPKGDDGEWKVYSGRAVEITQVNGEPIGLVREEEPNYDTPEFTDRVIAPLVYKAAALGRVDPLESRTFLEDVRKFEGGATKGLTKKGALQPTKKVAGRSSIVRDIENTIARPFLVGKSRILSRAFGFYRTGPETFAIRIANDMDTIAHELGHHMHKVLFGVRGPKKSRFPEGKPKTSRQTKLAEAPLAPWAGELMPLARTSDASITEGWAEFWRIWLTNPEKAQALAPELIAYVERRLAEEHPEIHDGMRRWQRVYTAYAQASPWARILAQMALDPPKRSVGARRKFHRLYKAAMNDLAFLDVFERDVTGVRKPTKEFIEALPGHMADLARGSAGEADHFLRRAPTDVKGRVLTEVEVLDREKMRGVVEQARRLQRMAREPGVPAKDRARLEARVRTLLRDTDLVFTTRKAKSLEAILNQIEDAEILDFEVYSVARRAVELHSRAIETGIEEADAQRTVEEFDRLRPVFAEAFLDLQAYNTSLLQLLRDGGVITQETYRSIILNNLDYVPFYRKFDDRDGRTGGPPKHGGIHGHIFSPIRKIKGSGRDILSPLDSIIKHTYLYTRLVANQQVFRAIHELGGLQGTGEWLQRIDPASKVTKVHRDEIMSWLFEQQGFTGALSAASESIGEGGVQELLELYEQTMMVYRPGDFFGEPNVISVLLPNGDRAWYKINDPDLYDSILALAPQGTDPVVKMLGLPAQWLRAGATSLSPEFVARNPIRDQTAAFFQSEYGFLPGIDLARGLFHLLGRTEAYWMWKRSRGEYSALVDMDRKTQQERIRQMLGAGRIRNVVMHPLQTLQIVSAWMESATRLAEYTNVIRSGGERTGVLRRMVDEFRPSWRLAARERLEGGADRGLQLLAGHASREITTNFSTHGAAKVVTALRHWTAFWNARLQGHQRWMRAFKDDPVGTGVKVFAAIVIPEIIFYSINRDDPEYWEQPLWLRDYFHLVKIPVPFARELPRLLDGLPEDSWARHLVQPLANHDGTVWLRFPKAFELGTLLGGATARILGWADGEDAASQTASLREAFSRELIDTFLPVPTAVLPIVENIANYNFFFGRNLDSPFAMNIPREFRTGRWPILEEFARMQERIGLPASIRQSPNQLENLWMGYTGTFGRHLLRTGDAIYGGSRDLAGREAPSRPTEFADIPGIGGFVTREPSWSGESVRRFFLELQASTAAYETLLMWEREDRLDLADQYYPPEEQDLVRVRYGELRASADAMASFRAQRDIIERDPNIPAEEKHELITDLGRDYLEEAQSAIGRVQPAQGPFPARFRGGQ